MNMVNELEAMNQKLEARKVVVGFCAFLIFLGLSNCTGSEDSCGPPIHAVQLAMEGRIQLPV